MGLRERVGARLMGKELQRLEDSVQLMHEAYLSGPFVMTPTLLHQALSEIDSQLLDLYVNQLGFELIGGNLQGYGTDSTRERIRAIEEARRLYKYDVITQWAVWTWTNYGFGEKIEVEPEDENAQVDWTEFWTATRNAPVLRDDKLQNLSTDILVDGEIFLVYFVGADGKSTVRVIPTEEIESIVTDPEDSSVKLFYRRRWRGPNGETVAYYPDWQAFYEDGGKSLKRAILQAGITRMDAPSENGTYAVVQHVSHNIKRPQKNTTSEMRFRGWPITTSSAPWSRAHKNFRENRATVAAAVAMYVNKLKHQGGSRASDAIHQKLASTMQTSQVSNYETNPPAVAGSTWIENAALSLERMPLTTGASDAKIDGESLFLMANLGLGLFPHYAGAGDAYRLATATAMERPLEMQWSRYQLFWSSQFKMMVTIVLNALVRASQGKYKTLAASVSTDRLVEVDLQNLSASVSQLYRDTLIPLVEIGALGDDVVKAITANLWRIVLQAIGVAQPGELASDEAFGVDEDEEMPEAETARLGESHSAEEVRRRCPFDDCTGDISLKYPDHKGLLVCATCGKTYDPEVE